MTTTSRPRVERPTAAPDLHASAERRQAARALLREPLLHADPAPATDRRAGPLRRAAAARADDLRLVRRHRRELAQLFAEGLGYRLVVTPDAARLFKAGLGRDPTRPLLRRSGRAFTPRGYALLCLTVATLTRAKSQLLVDELVAQVRSTAVDAGIDLDLDGVADRRALHAVFLALTDRGVLFERDGDLEHWADQRTLALLDVRRDRLALLLAAPLGSVEAPEALLDVAALPSAAGGARVAVRRRLVEAPVLSVDDLSDDQAEWWRRNRQREADWFRARLGLVLELRAEGALALDPADELSDLDFPGAGSTRHFALLWLDWLVRRVKDAAGDAPTAERTWWPIDAGEVLAAATDVFSRWSVAMRREYRENPARVRADAQGLLVTVGLVRVTAGGGWRLHAAAARFGAAPVLTTPAAGGQPALFGDVVQEEP